MKQALFLVLVIAMAASCAWAVGRSQGASPQTQTVVVGLTIPIRVGIYLDADVSIDLGRAAGANIAHYPPAAFPGYYIDDNAAGFNPTLYLQTFCNKTAGYNLTVQAGAANFWAGAPVSQLYFAPVGTAQTADGVANPAAPWTAFSNAAPVTVLSPVAATAGWEDHNQDYEYQSKTTDVAGGPASVTMTYTITAK